MAQIPPQPQSRDEFKIAIICALSLEAEMVQSVFDEDWEDIDLGQAKGDQNAYSLGAIGKHNVVLAHMPDMGGISAAAVAANLVSSYHNIEVAFVVGICGVTPIHPVTQKEIILGDCVVSTTLIQYDFGRQYPGAFKRKTGLEDTLGRANRTIRGVVAKLQTAQTLKRLSLKLQHHLKALQEVDQIAYPGCHKDRLYNESYLHRHHDTIEICDHCIRDIGICTKDCETLKCEESELIDRDRLNENGSFATQPQLHFGRYGSANTVLKSGEDRERLVTNEGIVAFEMEGAGVLDNLPTILIKSACDYADSHKNKRWQRYAAATAAAGLKSILEFWRITDSGHDKRPMPINVAPSVNESIHEADEVIRQYYRSGGRLLIERLSGEELDLEKCFINLALIERGRDKEEKSSFSLEARLRLDASSIGQSVNLENIFETRKLANGKAVVPRRIFIQGRAGIGKTTLCKKIVYEFLEGRLGQTLFDRLLWIPLRKLKTIQKEYGWQEFLQDAYPLTNPKWRQAKKLYTEQFYDSVFIGKTLFLFDGLDEISQQWKQDDPIYEFFKTTVCDMPNIIITSRPQANTLNIRCDLDLETVGFTPQQISTYIRNCVEDEGVIAKIEAVIAQKPLLQGLLRIPIQLDAFCYTWTSEDRSTINSLDQNGSGTSTTLTAEGSSTMTTLYHSIVIELCRKDLRRLQRIDQPQRLMSSRVLPLLKEEIRFLGELAFQGMVNNVIEFTPKHQDRVAQLLTRSSMEPSSSYSSIPEELSFLRASDAGKDRIKQNHHFIHLTFQEFFAAKHFTDHWLHDKPLTCLQLIGSRSYQSKMPTSFLQEKKYNPRYNIFWRFVTGLISEENGLTRFFEQLHAEPRDLLGATHRRLLMYCLSEVIPYQNQEVQELYDREADLLQQELIIEYKATGRIELCVASEFPEKVLCRYLQDELDLPYNTTLSTLARRSMVQLETLEAVASKLSSTFSTAVRLLAAEVVVKNSATCSSHTLEHTIAFLITLFRHDDWEERGHRNSAVRILRDTSLPGNAINVLLIALKDKNLQVRSSAAKALAGQSLADQAINALLIALKDEDPDVRSFAAEALRKQSLTDQAIDTLLIALKDEDSNVRFSAAEALEGHSLPDQAINALLTIALADKNRDRRSLAVDLLRHQSSLPDRATNALIIALEDEDWRVRSSAAEALGMQSYLSEEAINALIIALKDGNSQVRASAAQALGEQSLPDQAIDALLIALKDGSSQVRSSAAKALGKQSLPDQAINALLIALKDEDWDVQSSAAKALGGHSLPDQAIDALLIALKDEGSNVRSFTAEALGGHSLPDQAIDALLVALKDEDSNVSYSATHVLSGQILPDRAIDTLLIALEDKNWDLRFLAAHSLRHQSSLPDRAINALIVALKDEGRSVRFSAAKALGVQSYLAEEAINALIIALKDEDRSVRSSAAEALGRQSCLSEAAINASIEALKDEDHLTRSSAAKALGGQSSLSEEVINTLIAVLKHEDPDMTYYAAEILKQQSPLPEGAVAVLTTMLVEGNYKTYQILHRQNLFFQRIKDLDEQSWIHLWSHWLKWGLDDDVSCYQIEGVLYVWSDGIQHEISTDPARTFQLLKVVKHLTRSTER